MTTQEQVKDVVSQVLADKADKGGIKRVVWIGAGGSNGGNYPAQYFMEHEATQVVSSSYTSNEFVHATPAYVNESTLDFVFSFYLLQYFIQMIPIGIRNENLPETISGYQFYNLFHTKSIQFIKNIIQQQ